MLSLLFLINEKGQIIQIINAIPKRKLAVTNFDNVSFETLTDRFEYNWYNGHNLKVLSSLRSWFKHSFFLPIQTLPVVKRKLMKLNFEWQVGPTLEPESPNSGAIGYLEIALESWSMFCRIALWKCLGDEFWLSFPGSLRNFVMAPEWSDIVLSGSCPNST